MGDRLARVSRTGVARWQGDLLDEVLRQRRPQWRSWSSARIASLGDGRKKYLFTPGPTPVPPQVLAALAEPVVHHRSPDFRPVYERCLARLREVCRTEQDVLLFGASGHRRIRVGGREPRLAGRAAPRRLLRQLRRALGGASPPRTAPMSTTCATPGARRPIRTTCARGCASAARKPSGSCTPRRRPASSPTCRRSPRPRRSRERSSSSMRSRASARCRARRTPGVSTSSSPARRRR